MATFTVLDTAMEGGGGSGGSGGGVTDHGALTGLADDDHAQYPLLLGRAGGQTLKGGTAAGDDLIFTSTSNGTKGNIWFGTASGINFDEVTNSIGLGTAPVAGYLMYLKKATGDTILGLETAVNTGSCELQLFAGVRGGFIRQYGFSGAGSTQGQTNADCLHMVSGGVEGIAMLIGGDFDFKVHTNAIRRITVNSAGLTIADAHNIIVNATTGTKIGTATSQKLAFFNSTPVVQPAAVTAPSGGAVQDAESRTAIGTLITRLQTLGLTA